MMRKELVLVGAGGFGREVAWQISQLNEWRILGFVDNDIGLTGSNINGLPVLGNNAWLENYESDICVAITIANPVVKERVYYTLKTNPRLTFPAIIAKDVQIADSARLGKGCIICLSSIITVNVKLGDFVAINPRSSVAHDTEIGCYSTLYYNVNIAGNVSISNHVEIGTGSTVIQGKAIGEKAIIGAGAVVVKDIPSGCTAVGVPAIPI